MSDHEIEKILKLLDEKDPKIISSDFVDKIDSIYLKTCDSQAAEYCPPHHIRKIVQGDGSIWSYATVGAEFTSYLKIFCDLKSTHKILDVGCGCGRVATHLKYFLKAPGEYFGIDPVPELIQHAKKILISPLFHFTHMNIFHEMYNPDPNAIKHEEIVFPYEDHFFDIVYLVSIFSHIVPPIKNYINEIFRVLKTNGKCMISVFLFQNNPSYLNGKWEEKFPKKNLSEIEKNPDKDFFRVGNVENPDEWVIYDLDYLTTLFRNSGLELIKGPFWGNWSGNPNWLSHQDILVFQKNK